MENKEQRLFERLNANLADFQAAWEKQSKSELICNSREITAVRDAHEHLTTSHGFEPEEVDYLLLFDNPLQVVSDKWLARMEDTSDFSFALDEVLDKRDALRDYELAQDKPSVLEKLRSATNLAAKPAKAAAKEQEVR